MRKYALIVILAVLIVLLFIIMIFGIGFGNFKLVYGYSGVENLNEQKYETLNNLKELNEKEYAQKNSSLKVALANFNKAKASYTNLELEGKVSKDQVYNYMNVQNMDTLWKKIGDYASQKGVLLDLKVNKNEDKASIIPECNVCDLEFTVTGEYIAITDFIYSLEDDDLLGFEISNFSIKKGETDLIATFTVNGITIESNK